MKKLVLMLVLALAATLAAQQAGQAGKGKKTSSTAAADKKAGKTTTLTGCISSADGTYKLTNGRHRKGVEVSSSQDLKPHVGHKVKLSGSWEKSGTMKAFKADKLDMISETCAAPAAKGKGKAKKTGTPPA